MRCALHCPTLCAEGELCWLRGCDDIGYLVERNAQRNNARVIALIEETDPTAAARLRLELRNVELGITQARATWSALSEAQRRVLTTAVTQGRFQRVGKQYRQSSQRAQATKPIYAPTMRNLCARDLMAWDGGAFDPEAAAVITEHGRFVYRQRTS